MVKIVASIYCGPNKEGDFSWMITRPEYDDVIFIYNDNEEAFLSGHGTAGAGNAVIRPYSKLDPPQAMGIPTGFIKTHKGYLKLTLRVKKILDLAISRIVQVVRENPHIKRIFYSADKDGKLGTKIFKVGENVKTYIIEQLHERLAA